MPKIRMSRGFTFNFSYIFFESCLSNFTFYKKKKKEEEEEEAMY